ncbi:MAG TPA: DUF2231 domain-containing protein [Gemmatimonas sp.]|uniref:DUF2231 domain-containing protein n=1 Tax=Gemmatimonas sp. TaxID=1962908 RepID=UPI002EDA8F3E
MFESLLPNPLHPAVVHFPIVLALLVPLFAIGALVMIRRQARPVRAWGLATALFVALSISAWVAVETGEDTSERVESVVAEAPLEAHEEAAENFLRLSVLVTVIAVAGLAAGRVGQGARLAATLGALVLLVAGWRVGHSGGALVYQHGAASAYATGSAGCRDCPPPPETH